MHFVELQLPDGTPVFINPDQVKVLRRLGSNTSVEFHNGYAVEVAGEPKQAANKLER